MNATELGEIMIKMIRLIGKSLPISLFFKASTSRIVEPAASMKRVFVRLFGIHAQNPAEKLSATFLP